MTDARAALTPLGVTVLGLLREGDMHPYEMMRLIRDRGRASLVPLTNGTFYRTVGRLESQGLIAEVGIDRDGNRPERTTYTLTDRAVAASQEWMRRELVRTGRDVEFRVALAEAHDLEVDEVIRLLSVRRADIAAQLELLETRLHGARARSVPDQFLVERARHRVLLRADLDWMDEFIAGLTSGDIAWGIAAIPADLLQLLASERASHS